MTHTRQGTKTDTQMLRVFFFSTSYLIECSSESGDCSCSCQSDGLNEELQREVS